MLVCIAEDAQPMLLLVELQAALADCLSKKTVCSFQQRRLEDDRST